ncbi:MAG: phage holin family protein [Chlamydiota bacterium]
MIAIIIALLLNAIVLFFAAYIIPGVRLYSFWNAVAVAVLIGILHALIHHSMMWMALPPSFFIYFLCTFIMGSIFIYLLSLCLPGFEVDGWKWIFIFSFIAALFNALIHHFIHA